MSNKNKATKSQVEQALADLRDIIKPGDTIRTIIRHVSRSGMMRRISPILIRDGSDFHIDHPVSIILNGKRDVYSGDGVRMDGCGMDMAWALVYNLSYCLFPDGFECVGQGCPSNDHSNGDCDYTPHHHKDGGYALRNRTI